MLSPNSKFPPIADKAVSASNFQMDETGFPHSLSPRIPLNFEYHSHMKVKVDLRISVLLVLSLVMGRYKASIYGRNRLPSLREEREEGKTMSWRSADIATHSPLTRYPVPSTDVPGEWSKQSKMRDLNGRLRASSDCGRRVSG